MTADCIHYTHSLTLCNIPIGPAREDPANWESWWLPNARFLEEYGIVTPPVDDEEDESVETPDDDDRTDDLFDWSLPDGLERNEGTHGDDDQNDDQIDDRNDEEVDDQNDDEHVRGEDYDGALDAEPEAERESAEEPEDGSYEVDGEHERGKHSEMKTDSEDTSEDNSVDHQRGKHSESGNLVFDLILEIHLSRDFML